MQMYFARNGRHRRVRAVVSDGRQPASTVLNMIASTSKSSQLERIRR